VESLFDQIHAQTPAGEKTLLPGELIVRETVAPPPQMEGERTYRAD
jgi:hypothetical protein